MRTPIQFAFVFKALYAPTRYYQYIAILRKRMDRHGIPTESESVAAYPV